MDGFLDCLSTERYGPDSDRFASAAGQDRREHNAVFCEAEADRPARPLG
jgi:hypothetical protein